MKFLVGFENYAHINEQMEYTKHQERELFKKLADKNKSDLDSETLDKMLDRAAELKKKMYMDDSDYEDVFTEFFPKADEADVNEALLPFDWEDWHNTELAGPEWDKKVELLFVEFKKAIDQEMPQTNYSRAERKNAIAGLFQLCKNNADKIKVQIDKFL